MEKQEFIQKLQETENLDYELYLLDYRKRQVIALKAQELLNEAAELSNNYNDDTDDYWELYNRLENIAGELYELEAYDELIELHENTGAGCDYIDILKEKGIYEE